MTTNLRVGRWLSWLPRFIFITAFMSKFYPLALVLLVTAACHQQQPKQVDNPGDTVPASVFEPDTTNKVNPEDTLATDTSISVIDETKQASRVHKPARKKTVEKATPTE